MKLKKLFAICTIFFVAKTIAQPCNFTITPLPIAGAYYSNCFSLQATLSAMPANYNYTWAAPGNTVNGNSAIIYNGICIVTAVDGTCTSQKTINIIPPPAASFTINNITGSNSITCLSPTIDLQAIPVYTYWPMSYTWTSPSFTAYTSSVNITTGGIYTVTAINLVTECVSQQTLSIAMNNTVPSSSINPSTESVTCNNAASFTATAISPTINIEHKWFTPIMPYPSGPSAYISTTQLSFLNSYAGPGIYTHVLRDVINGCFTLKTVTVISTSAYPSFSLSSLTNFTVGCSPLNQTTISILNPVSNQTPAATCSYTFLPPTFAGVVTPSVILGGNTYTTSTIPGTWTVIVQDNNNFCRTIVDVPVISNTVAPHVLSSMLTQTLTCNNPTILAIGSSTTPNTIVSWNPPNIFWWGNNTIEVGPSTGPNTSTVSLVYANYTVIAQNTMNACQTISVVQIYQNFKPPKSCPTISIGTSTAINCETLNNPVVLTTGTCYPQWGWPPAFIANPCWTGPAPQTPTCGQSSYSCYVPGIYSLTVMDNYNGCTSLTGTVNVTGNGPQFGLQGTAPSSSASCNGSLIVTTQVADGYTLSASTGSLSGTSITNLCYGYVKVCMTFTANGCKKCDSLLINSATGINELNLEEEITLYPNPTSSSLFIKNTSGKNATVKIFNVEGRIIEVLEALESTDSRKVASSPDKLSGSATGNEIEIKNLNAGIYLVEMNVEGVVLRKKVVVIH